MHHMLLYRLRSAKKVDLALWALAAVFGALGVLTMRGNVAALCAAFALEISVYVVSLRTMVRFELPDATEQEILGGCGITASQGIPRQR